MINTLNIYLPHTKRLEGVESHVKKLLMCLPRNLSYHNADHTLHPVLGVAAVTNKLADMEGASPRGREIAVTAAYFHDVGYIRQYAANEPIGARMAGEVLPSLDYTQAEIQRVQSLILATNITFEPQTLLENIIRDADLDYLGRNDFFEKLEALRKEKDVDPEEWIRSTMKFLKEHKYHTASARFLREDKKQQNMAQLGVIITRKLD